MQPPAPSQHSVNNSQKENLQIGNLSKSNSNQITLFAKFVNLKLLTGSLLLLLLAACGGETSNNGKTGNNGDEKPGIDKCKADNTIEGCPGYVAPPKVDKCKADNTIEGCPGYVAPPKVDRCNAQPTPERCTGITNSYLTQDKLKAGVPNYIIRNTSIYVYSVGSAYGKGKNINEISYGTIAGIGTKYKSDTFKTFKEATDADKKDDDKNNIIKISTYIPSKADETAKVNYYYSHIKGKQFTQFLPAINKVEILALNSEQATEEYPDNIIFSADYLGGNKPKTYGKLKDFVFKAKDYTFNGFTLVKFSNRVLNDYITDEDLVHLYPGSFKLTFNSSFVDGSHFDTASNNYFSMKITLNQQAEAQTTPSATSVARPAVKTIEIKNFNFLNNDTGNATTGKFRSYPSDHSPATVWSFKPGFYNSYLAFSQKQGKTEQIAGTLLLFKEVDAVNTTPSHTQYIEIAYASNEVCFSGTSTTGTADCPKVSTSLRAW